ncbi:MAG: hypothetical protein WBR21_05770 [Rouxiella badensis]|uniref:hypothetical protein n=1 Tax=Rouxiella badensis TaxID=1646377 RepID=UPI003C6AB1B8
MKKVMLLLILAVCSQAAIAGEDQYQLEAQGAVREKLATVQLKSSCSLLAAMAKNDISKRPSAIASCDNDFSLSDGLNFSDMNTFNHNGETYVCGIASGKTALSRIGARFIFRNSDKHITFKYSKYPFLYSASDQSARTAVVIQTNQYRIEHDQYCK